MTNEEMKDILHELIVVDTDKNLIQNSSATDNTIIFTTNCNETFKITLEKIV